MPQLQIFEPGHLRKLTRIRPEETKLGEVVAAGWEVPREVRYVIIGIPEDIGVRANHGIGGAHTAWPAFLDAFLNIQSTSGLTGKEISIAGFLDCSDLIRESLRFTFAELREAVTLIDREVEDLIFQITANGKIPVVIGGGHNNAYPIIKGASKGYRQSKRIEEEKINSINLDAHSDFRIREGRHSGNGFRFAFSEGFLDRYAMIGLHENYNSRDIVEEMRQESRLHFSFWEDIFLRDQLTFEESIARALTFTESRITGIELDLDAVERTLSSAVSPVGISPTLARKYMYRCAANADVAYLHICEGAIQMENGVKDPYTGKLIAYLVSDFLRAQR